MTTDDLVFRLLLAALLLGFMAHRGYSTRKMAQPAAETVRERPPDGTQRAGALLAAGALISSGVYIVFPAWLAWAALPLPDWLRWGGVALALAGFGLLQWAHVALGRNWSDTPRLLREQALVTDGPYRWARHPIYTAFLMILGAPLLISANWLVGGLWLAATGLDIAGRVRFEETLLEEQFGAAYHAYAARTGRLAPRLGRR